ncbi:ribokinase [Salinisphaera hydrothermalis]|uniref:Ribokinase n=1 Tax=Salinisphaera hydrothermalis (strain C41B8) TaxID=1304275 RepID=A0A084IIE5_SALHC|nr:ribokinase [Salinisphaera hydrothermalis]KEZ76479.1 ribokinase [Salinisphaera hydrothermalis C41B8]
MIVVAGSANIDLVARVSHHPEPGETLMASGYAVHQGGKGANQAVAAARLGAPVRFLGAAGDDDFGNQIVANLTAEGIDADGVQRFPGSSGIALITVDNDGENRIVVVPGANGQLDDSRDLAGAMGGATALLVQLETPTAFVNAALAAGHAAGAEVILNAAPAAPLKAFAMDAVDWLMVNAGEAAFVLGEREGATRDETADQARRLAKQYDIGVIVTLGADGALWIGRDGSQGHVPGRPTTVVDTTGAGDTFAGAFAAARAEGQSVEDAIRMAGVAASLSVGAAGARAGMPDRSAVRAAMGE